MFPTLIQIGPIVISSLGFFSVLGYFFGSFLIWKKAKEENFEEEKIMDAIILVGLSSLVTSRLWFVLSHWQKLNSSINSLFDFIGKPGMSWFGALLGGTIILKLISKQNKWDFFRVADFSTYGLNLALVLISFGLFLDGNGFIWESITLLLFFRLLYYFDRNYRTYNWYKNKRGEAAPGFLFIMFLVFLSILKIAVAFAKIPTLYLFNNLYESILVILLGAGLIYFRSGLYSGEIINFKTFFNKLPKLPVYESKKRMPKHKFHYKAGREAK